jgi:hypothetical protein
MKKYDWIRILMFPFLCPAVVKTCQKTILLLIFGSLQFFEPTVLHLGLEVSLPGNKREGIKRSSSPSALGPIHFFLRMPRPLKRRILQTRSSQRYKTAAVEKKTIVGYRLNFLSAFKKKT